MSLRPQNLAGMPADTTRVAQADGPHLITDVQMTIAPRTDKEVLPDIQDRLAQRELLPKEQLVDAGYVIAENLVDSQVQHGVLLVGPVIEDHSWQAKEGQGFDAASFTIDWEQKKATCPQGKTSAMWNESRAPYGLEIVHIYFHQKDCAICPVRDDCTRTKSQRRGITVNARPYHEALQAARARQETEAFKEQYKTRAGVEGTISEAVRVEDLRRARYRGLAKTRLQHLATAAAINLRRLGAWLLERPRAKTRTSAFMATGAKSGLMRWLRIYQQHRSLRPQHIRMSWWDKISLRLRALLHKDRVERELDAELCFLCAWG